MWATYSAYRARCRQYGGARSRGQFAELENRAEARVVQTGFPNGDGSNATVWFQEGEVFTVKSSAKPGRDPARRALSNARHAGLLPRMCVTSLPL